jgi:NAD+ synthase
VSSRSPPSPEIPLPDHALETLTSFLRSHRRESGARGFVVALSGGVDSALVGRLAVESVGASRVRGFLLPDREYPEAWRRDVQSFARDLGIELREVSLEPALEGLRPILPAAQDRVQLGNAKARLRMLLLYAFAREGRELVLGTGNKSEILLGYFTKYGDGGCDLLPLGDLYKVQVWKLAELLGIPREIRERPPTAGLWEGQTDEGELGMSYRLLDPILDGLERLEEPEAIARRLGISRASVDAIVERVRLHRHKRNLPPIPKLGWRTVGLDWRD